MERTGKYGPPFTTTLGDMQTPALLVGASFLTIAAGCAVSNLARDFADASAQENALAREVKEFEAKELPLLQAFNACAAKTRDLKQCDHLTKELTTVIGPFEDKKRQLLKFEQRTNSILNAAKVNNEIPYDAKSYRFCVDQETRERCSAKYLEHFRTWSKR